MSIFFSKKDFLWEFEFDLRGGLKGTGHAEGNLRMILCVLCNVYFL